MELDYYSPAEGVAITSDRTSLDRLADLMASGGELNLGQPAQPRHLRGVLVVPADGTVAIGVDERGYLTVRGGAECRSVLADLLRDVAAMDDGGHVHLEYVEGHEFLAPHSVPLILTSPHGGMPRRRPSNRHEGDEPTETDRQRSVTRMPAWAL
ncbi:Imm32 family immunity protein [Micromonospora sp. WMMD729]|uniref:Imm32 family immunity protein n=1 Tax=Micromonospora sp. WMMD729 TaxID=3404127 RepID=UPI003BF5D7EF